MIYENLTQVWPLLLFRCQKDEMTQSPCHTSRPEVWSQQWVKGSLESSRVVLWSLCFLCEHVWHSLRLERLALTSLMRRLMNIHICFSLLIGWPLREEHQSRGAISSVICCCDTEKFAGKIEVVFRSITNCKLGANSQSEISQIKSANI